MMSNNPEDYELYHFGVKGMKWGVRNSDNTSSSSPKERKKTRKELDSVDNPKYKPRTRQLDQDRFGKSFVRDKNREMNRGSTYAQADKKALRKSATRTLTKTAVVLAGSAIALDVMAGQSGMTYSVLKKVADSKSNQRAQQAARDAVLKITTDRTLKVAKKRGGAFLITNM